MKPIAEQWAQFEEIVLGTDIPAIQRKEMKRAFYAGAQGIIFAVIGALSPGNEPTKTDLRIMTAIENELLEFASEIQKGKA